MRLNNWIVFTLRSLVLSLAISAFVGCSPVKRISDPLEHVKLYPIAKNGLWAYADENGDITIDYQFQAANFFSSGLAGVKKENKYGFINRQGKFEIKPQYDSVNRFSHNAAWVYKNGKTFGINRKGKKIKNYTSVSYGGCIPPTEVAYAEDYFVYENEKYQIIQRELKQQQRLDPQANFTISDFTFDEVIPFTSRSFIVKRGDKYGIYVPFNGVGLKEIWVEEIIPHYSVGNNDGKLYEANYASFKVDNKWGVLSELGKVVIAPEFYRIKKAIGVFFLVEYKPKHWGHMTLSKKYFKY